MCSNKQLSECSSEGHLPYMKPKYKTTVGSHVYCSKGKKLLASVVNIQLGLFRFNWLGISAGWRDGKKYSLKGVKSLWLKLFCNYLGFLSYFELVRVKASLSSLVQVSSEAADILLDTISGIKAISQPKQQYGGFQIPFLDRWDARESYKIQKTLLLLYP